jgi:copper chaperone
MENINLTVNGMSCGHCEKAIHDALMAAPGIKSVKASAGDNNVEVSFHTEKISTGEIKEIIEEEGYDVID